MDDDYNADYLIPIMFGVGLWLVALVALAWYCFRPPRGSIACTSYCRYGSRSVPVASASWPFAGAMLAAWAPAGIIAWFGAARQRGSPQAHSPEEGVDRDAHLHERR